MSTRTATYTITKRITVDGVDVGATLGSDYVDWRPEAARVLRAHGYIPVGTWEESADFAWTVPVEHHGQAASLGAVRLAGDHLTLCQDATQLAQAALQQTVRETLAAGVSAVDIAAHLGVTRARVYQLRDGRR